MPRQFNPDAARNNLALSSLTGQQIAALMADLDASASDVVSMSVALLHQQELGEPDRDVLAEMDELRQRIERLAERMHLLRDDVERLEDHRQRIERLESQRPQ